jgi:hypothetical protein
MLGLPLAHDRGRGGDEGGQPVERPLGPCLLRDPDGGVGDEDAQEEGVAPVAVDERERAEDRQDQVEDREDVGADDARV